MKTLIPKKAMDELKSLLDSDIETIDFAKDESTLFFRVGPRLLTSRQLTGQFPNYEAVLPKDITKSILVRGEELGVQSPAWRSLPTSVRVPCACASKRAS